MEYTPVENDIYLTEPAVFDVLIKNNENFENAFRVTVPDFIAWSSDTQPQSLRISGVKVEPKTALKAKLLLYPKNIQPGRKLVQVIAKSDISSEQIGKFLNVNIKSEFAIPQYEPNLLIEVQLPNEGKFDPREQQRISVKVKNKNALDLSDITIKLKSKLIETETKIDSLEPLGTELKDFVLSFDPLEKPQKDSLVVEAKVGNKTFVAIEDYEIIPYYPSFQQEVTTNKKFLKTENIIIVTNIANARNREKITYITSFFKELITSTSPKALTIEENGNKYLMWDIELESTESRQLTIIYSYRGWLLFFLLIILCIIGYYLYRSPIVITKKAANIAMSEGGISDFKVIMHVKNRSNKRLEYISIIDKIPKIANIIDEFDMGILKPSKIIRHEYKGTLIKWVVESLEANDEVIVSYRIKSRLSILGNFTLPRAVGKFKQGSRERKTYSNLLTI